MEQTEEEIINSFKEKSRMSRTLSPKESMALETIDNIRKSLEGSLRASETDKGSRKSSGKQPEVLETVDELPEDLQRSSRASDPAVIRKSSEKQPDAAQTVVSRQSSERASRTSAGAQESRGSQQRKMSLGSNDGALKSVNNQQDLPKYLDVPVAIMPQPSPRTTKSPSKANLPERPVSAPRTVFLHSQPQQAMQNHAANFMHRWMNFIPREYRGELWLYAAGYVFLYSLIMLFCMSTFGFICMIIYVTLISLLILRYFGIGPLVSARTQ